MRYLSLIILLTGACTLNGQQLSKQLEKQLWYVSGQIYKGDTCSLHIEKQQKCSGYLLLKQGELDMFLEGSEQRFACHYEIIEDKLLLYYTITNTVSRQTDKVNIYYKISERSFGREYRLVPVAALDFK